MRQACGSSTPRPRRLDADAQGFGNFVLAGTELLRGRRVNGNTAVAAQGDRHGKRNQFAGLGVKMSRLRAGTAERHIALDSVRRELADLADAAENLVSIVVPIKHSHFILHRFAVVVAFSFMWWRSSNRRLHYRPWKAGSSSSRPKSSSLV